MMNLMSVISQRGARVEREMAAMLPLTWTSWAVAFPSSVLVALAVVLSMYAWERLVGTPPWQDRMLSPLPIAAAWAVSWLGCLAMARFPQVRSGSFGDALRFALRAIIATTAFAILLAILFADTRAGILAGCVGLAVGYTASCALMNVSYRLYARRAAGA